MKQFIFLILVASFSTKTLAQNNRLVSPEQISKMPEDSNKIKALIGVAESYYFIKPDSCYYWASQSLALSKKLNFISGRQTSMHLAAEALRFIGDFPKAIQYNLESLQNYRDSKDIRGETSVLGFLAFDYIDFGEFNIALNYAKQAYALSKTTGDQLKMTFNCSHIGYAYDLLGQSDSALFYQFMALKTYQGLKHGPLKSLILTRLGVVYANKKHDDSALYYYRQALKNIYLVNDQVNKSKVQGKMSQLFERADQYDSSLYYARMAFENGSRSAQKLELMETAELLSRLYKNKMNLDSAYYYEKESGRIRTELFGPEKFRHLQLIMLNEQQKIQEKESEQQDFKYRSRIIALVATAVVLLIIGFILWRTSRQNKKARERTEQAYSNLKAAQQQLIHREKMASLGELTAGIAHEIQNPLNFVNNFSEVNKELLNELKDLLVKGKDSTVTVPAKDLAENILENEEKILFHGKRADGIVKNMLEHSHSAAGEQVITDLNSLIEEYIKLALSNQNIRAKNYEIRINRNYDNSIGQLKIIPREIGRVILNIINNAVYAIKEKADLIDFTLQPQNYVPEISISTKKTHSNVLIIIKDNGNGIPEKIMTKVMQPFFTTKPAGQGTGLGLSLSYDIIKSHNGEIKISSKPGEFTEVIVML
jgi:two-component system, NtrC family, sensor kinase